MPCKGGYRHNIEAVKLREAAEKRQRESPAARHARWLVAHVTESPRRFARLSAANQSLFAACLVEQDVYDDGFEKYFSSRSADYYPHAASALAEMGAEESLRLLQSAKAVLSGAGPMPTTRAARRRLLRATAPTEQLKCARWQALNALDQLFCWDPDNFFECARNFGEKHGLYEAS